MSKQRPVNTDFWRDPYIRALPPHGKLLFLYLLTNPDTPLCNIYQLPKENMALDTGLELSIVNDLLIGFAYDNKVHYRDGWVVLVNRMTHQSQSPMVQKGIQREMSGISRDIIDFAKKKFEEKPYGIDTLSIPRLSIVKLSKVKSSLVKSSKARPKNVEEVQKYLDEKGIVVFNADEFWNFYESKGWMIGKNQMKDWRAAVGTWTRRSGKTSAGQKPFKARNAFLESIQHLPKEQRNKLIGVDDERK